MVFGLAFFGGEQGFELDVEADGAKVDVGAAGGELLGGIGLDDGVEDGDGGGGVFDGREIEVLEEGGGVLVEVGGRFFASAVGEFGAADGEHVMGDAAALRGLGVEVAEAGAGDGEALADLAVGADLGAGGENGFGEAHETPRRMKNAKQAKCLTGFGLRDFSGQPSENRQVAGKYLVLQGSTIG